MPVLYTYYYSFASYKLQSCLFPVDCGGFIGGLQSVSLCLVSGDLTFQKRCAGRIFFCRFFAYFSCFFDPKQV